MSKYVYKPLLDSSIKFLQLKKVYRWKLKKISEMSDQDIISACHAYVEDNKLNDEWYLFRQENEAFNDDYIFDIMNEVLNNWTTPIDISDGELRGDEGFYSYDLTVSHWDIDEKIPDTTEFRLMAWAVYRVLHKQARKNFIDGNYILDVRKLNRQKILEEYKTALRKAK